DLVFAHDGTHALDLLENHIPTPSLIILDINMPKMNGMQLLEKLKASSRWKHLPIIMLTTSQDIQMIQDAYQLGANSYLVKPYSYQKVSELFEGLYSYWVRTVQLPRK
uniref:response regulator n=1 Tax=Siphonobacter sp. TaxID=1869184 RepID=UPI003B3ACCE5